MLFILFRVSRAVFINFILCCVVEKIFPRALLLAARASTDRTSYKTHSSFILRGVMNTFDIGYWFYSIRDSTWSAQSSMLLLPSTHKQSRAFLITSLLPLPNHYRTYIYTPCLVCPWFTSLLLSIFDRCPQKNPTIKIVLQHNSNNKNINEDKVKEKTFNQRTTSK